VPRTLISGYVAAILVGIAALAASIGVPPANAGPAALASAAASPRLENSKVVITGRTFRQIFEPYLASEEPVFITTDTLLNAYHVLLAESFYRLEEANARRLPEVLERMASRLQSDNARHSASGPAGDGMSEDPAESKLRTDAGNYARVSLAAALQLLHETPNPADEELHRRTEAALKQWEARPADPLPEGLGAGFGPPVMYARAPALRRYYKAMQWLQTTPFRVERDEELLAILMLGKIVSLPSAEDDGRRPGLEPYFRCYRDLTGDGRGHDLLLAAQIVRDRPSGLNMVRDYLAAADSDGAGSTPVVPAGGSVFSGSKPFFIIAPSLPPDRRLADAVSAFIGESRLQSLGPTLCAALGSTIARRYTAREASETDRPQVLAAVNAAGAGLASAGFRQTYLKCLAALLDAPEPDAPAFMFNEAWQLKSCNTALAGWVQADRLQLTGGRPAGPEGIDTFGAPTKGFVEPEPEFFARFGDLVEQTKDIFSRCNGLVPARTVLAENLKLFARLIQSGRFIREAPGDATLSGDERAAVDRSAMILAVLADIRIDPAADRLPPDKILGEILALADALAAGTFDDDPTYQALVMETGTDLRRLWDILGRMCRKLEVMAHKQLRGVPFNEGENYFFGEFGAQLAAVMLYGGDGYLRPEDDAPLAVSRPLGGGNRFLINAVGRPRELVVLYPFSGREIRCRGGVLPYYEFSDTGALTETDWRLRLDGDRRPRAPYWLQPIMASAGRPDEKPAAAGGGDDVQRYHYRIIY
jgi:hypothetical protein